ncbi:mucin-17-like [Heterodontus francisci]|uniref:mucin-17-like n=1 Tax=Heterodontus francisci TaxID=7792 RepID=UPI00355B3C3F
MEAIQLTILAVLTTGLGGTTTMSYQSTAESERTEPITSTSFHDSSPVTLTIPGIITNTLIATSGPSSDHPRDTSSLTNTPSITSQFISIFSPEVQSIPSSTSQPTSHMETINQTTMFMTSRSTTKSSTKFQDDNRITESQNHVASSKIVAFFIGGVLLLMLMIICTILTWKRCSKNPVQDLTWAGTRPVPSGDDFVDAAEDNNIDAAPAKRPSLTTFLSKKSKRESLLDQCTMEMLEPEGIINPSSPEIEEKLIVPEVKVENETGKETQPLSETHETQTVNGTQSQDFPSPPLEAQAPLNDNDPSAPLRATDLEAPGPPQETPDGGPNTTSFPPPPPVDLLDLVNDFDLPPPLPEVEV